MSLESKISFIVSNIMDVSFKKDGSDMIDTSLEMCVCWLLFHEFPGRCGRRGGSNLLQPMIGSQPAA